MSATVLTNLNTHTFYINAYANNLMAIYFFSASMNKNDFYSITNKINS